MARQKHPLCSSFFRQPARGLQPCGARRRLVLHLEKLEDRFLMNGDPTPLIAVNLAADIDIDVASLVVADDIGPSNWRFSPGRVTATPEKISSSQLEELPAWLVAEADQRNGDLYGKEIITPRWNYWNWQSFGNASIDISDFDALTLFAATDTANDFSTTNTQVAGVDEADLVETDGEYLYVISLDELLILDVRENGNPKLASRTKLEARPTGIYLAGDRLTLITSGNSSPYAPNNLRNGLVNASWGGYRRPSPATTEVQVLDVSDQGQPKLVQSTEFDGRLVSSRMVAGELRIVLQQDAMQLSNLLPRLQQVYVGYDETANTDTYRYETRNEYLGRVYRGLENFSLPSYRTLTVEGQVLEEQPLITWGELAEPIVSRYASSTTIATFDTLGDQIGPTATKTLFTRSAAEIYATEDSLYVFGTSVNSSRSQSYNQTSIWKFDFDSSDHSIQLSATGRVDGQLLNQFAADEYDGFLRVVTTGRMWSSGQSLFVLQQEGKQLKTVGKVENLAPRERLHSVRFIDDEAFVVTFRRVDPLFAIDLSDPTKPVVAGELKIPGFSDYLQPLDENNLLGIGRGNCNSRFLT